MSLLHPAILYGLGLAVIPVVLHFLLRAKPKKLRFPALRLIQARRKNNVRRLRLRHIWLLLLRVLVILFLVLAIARPRLPAANYAFTLRETLTLLAIAGIAIAAYQTLVRRWVHRQIPNHVFMYRRAVLRGAVGGAVLLLTALLVFWPYGRRIAAEMTTPTPNRPVNVPVAGIFLFDTSLSMGYRLESKTRLDRAREIAEEHLSHLPPKSKAAIADTSTQAPILFQSDLVGAQSRMEQLAVRPVSIPLNDRLLAALRMQEDDLHRTLGAQSDVPVSARSDRYLREVYLFTDLAKSAWRMAAASRLQKELARLRQVQLYIVDVGVKQPRNLAIAPPMLSRQTLSRGGALILSTTVTSTGFPAADRTVELSIQNDAGKLVKRGRQRVHLGKETAAEASFTVEGLTGPVEQGEIRLVASDPLSADDVRYFTVAVRPPPEILVVAPRRDDAMYWMAALAPADLVTRGKARYNVTYLPETKLPGLDWKRYAVICLIDVAAPDDSTWKRLEKFVASGGGLTVVLGSRRIDPVSYNSAAARDLLPAELLGHIPFFPPESLDLSAKSLAHPVLKKFAELGGAGDLTLMDVRRCWRVKPRAGGAVIASYSDVRKTPALLERRHGEGRVLMLTTGVDRNWNDLPLAPVPFVILADRMMRYLGRESGSVYNFLAGEPVVVRLDPEKPIRRYLLRRPDLGQLPGDVPEGAGFVSISGADQLGHYEVVGAERDSTFATGFSVNVSPAESDLTRLTIPASEEQSAAGDAPTCDLDRLLGHGQYAVARSIEELNRHVQIGRIGQEMYSFVLLFVVVAFCVEHLAANRFYGAEDHHA